MPHLAEMAYTHRNQMRWADLGGGGDAYYTYAAGGERVLKRIVTDGGLIKERFYLGGWELYRERDGSGKKFERETLHVMDDARRVAMVETKTWEGYSNITDVEERRRWQYDNHLGSACVECDGSGAVISYEEYHAYGTPAYRAVKSGCEVPEKRYRYTGKERDDETGFQENHWRYYVPWLGRWTGADPVRGSGSAYEYCSGNPVGRVDPDGRKGKKSGTGDVIGAMVILAIVDPKYRARLVGAAQAAIGAVEKKISDDAAEVAAKAAQDPEGLQTRAPPDEDQVSGVKPEETMSHMPMAPYVSPPPAPEPQQPTRSWNWTVDVPMPNPTAPERWADTLKEWRAPDGPGGWRREVGFAVGPLASVLGGGAWAVREGVFNSSARIPQYYTNARQQWALANEIEASQSPGVIYNSDVGNLREAAIKNSVSGTLSAIEVAGTIGGAVSLTESLTAELVTGAAPAEKFFIENGVRRSLASREAQLTEIQATIFRPGQPPVTQTIRLDQLFSPKAEVVRDARFLRIQPPIHTPIQVQPLGLPGQVPTIPLNQVKLIP